MTDEQRAKPNKIFKALQPAPTDLLRRSTSSTSSNSLVKSPPTLLPSRTNIAAACSTCRQKKVKCGGQRPQCSRCAERDLVCDYDTREGETKAMTLKRKYQDLEDEVQQYKELYDLIQGSPGHEAQIVLERIRMSSNSLEALRSVRDAALLLPPPMISEIAGRAESRIAKIDAEALSYAPFKLHARPWITVVDDGLVSELVSGFFGSDHLYFFPAIDREAFLMDMTNGDAEHAHYCSPLLVNAICAHRCFWSARAIALGLLTGEDMIERFMKECKKLLDNQAGRASLPTVQALYLMFATACFQGKDRAGNMYRYMAVEMLKRLRLERRFLQLRDNDIAEVIHRRVISTALWGLFAFESAVCTLYRQPSLIRPPTIPRIFADNLTPSIMEQNFDIFGQPHDRLSTSIPQVPGFLHAICDLSILFYEIVKYNYEQAETASHDRDIATRARLYADWTDWHARLPPAFSYDHNFTPQTAWLRSHAFEGAVGILQPLAPHITLPGQTLTVKALCIAHCRQEIELGGRFLNQYPADGLIGRGQFMVLSTLSPHLDDPRVQDLFASSCHLLRAVTSTIPAMKVLLQAIEALVWGLGRQIPPLARPYFEGLKTEIEIKDLPTELTLPPLRKVFMLDAGEGEDGGGNVEAEISRLVAQWAGMTVDV